MSKTETLNNPVGDSGKTGKFKSRAQLIGAVAAGALTIEAANLILQHMGEKPLEDDDVQEMETAAEQNAESESMADNIADETTAEENAEQISGTQDTTDGNHTTTHPDNSVEIPSSPDIPIEISDEDMLDVILMDENDLVPESIMLVDDIGTIYDEDGTAYSAATVQDINGNQAVVVDVDGDGVYDVMVDPNTNQFAELPGDLDLGDAELMHAELLDDGGMLDLNDQDMAQNLENPDIFDDMSLL